MNLIKIKKVSLNTIVDKVINAFQALKHVVFQTTNGKYEEIEYGINQACSLIYPYIYLPTSKMMTVSNNMVVLSEHTRNVSLVAEYLNDGTFKALRDIFIIPPAIDDNVEAGSWKIRVKPNTNEVIVFAELECYVNNENVYLSDEECLIKQAVYEIAKGRSLKRMSYDVAPAATQEIASGPIEMAQFAAVAFEELQKLLAVKQMPRLLEIMGLPQHLGNKNISRQPTATDLAGNSPYISTRR